jgi:4'-phosphopantetheinyl transferase
MTVADLLLFDLDGDGADFELLDAGERARAERFRFELHRRRFIAARSSLRRILARYAGTAAHALEFAYGPHGKPGLPAHPELQFNLSHAADRALVAVARGRRVGVDLEQLRPLGDIEALARHTFAPGELARLRALPREQWTEGFFNAWTRKEAYLKALGTGLATSPQSFEVSLEPHAVPRLLRVADPGRWQLRALQPAPGWVAAVVVEDRGDVRWT